LNWKASIEENWILERGCQMGICRGAHTQCYVTACSPAMLKQIMQSALKDITVEEQIAKKLVRFSAVYTIFILQLWICQIFVSF
jgi:hypothetical protein